MLHMLLSVGGVSLISLTLAGCITSSGLSGDVYSSSEIKQVQNVAYGIVIHVRPVQIEGNNNESNVVGAITGTILGGFLGNTIGDGTGRSLASVVGAAAGGAAGQRVQSAMNKMQGIELEIRKDDGNTIIVVQQQGNTHFSLGQRVLIASNGSQVTVSPR